MPLHLLASRAVAVPKIASKKKRSKETDAPARKKRRKKKSPQRTAAKKKPRAKPAKRKAASKKKAPRKAAPKRKAPKKAAKKRTKAQRSEAAKKAWRKRKKKKRLLEKMADIRMQNLDQPVGWIERRDLVRETNDGKLWRQISLEYSDKEVDRVRLETLAQLEIDFLNRDELADYLGWMAEEIDIDLSDAYRFYLGYAPKTGATAPN